MEAIELTVNGSTQTVEADERTLLIQLLRDYLDLTGTRNGCMEARCGCCAVLMNKQSVKSCNVLALQAAGSDVSTVEGLSNVGKADHNAGSLNPLQQAFHEHGAVQCGFCTSGMLMVLTDFLSDNPTPTSAEVRDGIRGNLCRCTGYQKIVEAALSAAEQYQTNRPDASASSQITGGIPRH